MKRRRQIITIGMFIIVILLSAGGCSSDNIPDNGHDIVSMVYTNMKSPDSYSANTELTLTVQFTKRAVQTTLHSNVAAHKDPFEIITKSEGSILGEKEKITYSYMYENAEKAYLCTYNQGKWEKKEIQEEEKEAVSSPIHFGAYFIDIDSFEIVKKEDNEVVIEGRVMKENIEAALKDSGALRQFMLPSLPQEEKEKIADIVVRAWVNKDTLTITRAEIDMKEAMQTVINALLGDGGATEPKIMECRFVVDQIKLDTIDVVGLPKEVKDGLEALKS